MDNSFSLGEVIRGSFNINMDKNFPWGEAIRKVQFMWGVDYGFNLDEVIR